MALDTYSSIVGRVKLHCPLAGEALARDWVTNAFRRVGERRRWSWLMKQGQFILPALYNTGTVTVTNGSATVTGAATGWGGELTGRQFRIASTTPIYTIIEVVSATELTLSLPWGPETATTQEYQIYQAFQTPPSDFHAFISIWNPAFNWQLWRGVDQVTLNYADAQRANIGTSYVIASRDWNTTANLPEFELWPHNVATTTTVYPFLYEVRPTDLQDPDAVLPRYLRGDVLMEMALSQASRWPGTETAKNPYFDLRLSQQLEARSEFMIGEMERQDDETFLQNATYQMPYAPWPFPGNAPYPLDASWLQSHAL